MSQIRARIRVKRIFVHKGLRDSSASAIRDYHGDGDDQRDRDGDGEEKAGVQNGGSAQTRHKRPHLDGKSGELEACQGRKQRNRPIVGDAHESALATHSHFRMPRRRRYWDHSIHRSQ